MKIRLASLILLPLLAVAYAQTMAFPELRLSPDEVDAMHAHEGGSGTSGVAGIRTTIVAGDPAKAGPYTIRLTIPPNTRIQAHTHRDNRSAVVVSGMWYYAPPPSSMLSVPCRREASIRNRQAFLTSPRPKQRR
jgi:hypothetical protein